MIARSRPFAAVFASISLALAGCSQEEAKPAAPADAEPAASAGSESGVSAGHSLIAATREFAANGCAAARRRLELCAACDSPEQKPLRDLLLAYCREREAPSEARTLYEAIITEHPNTEASVTAIMRVRQIDAAELPPLATSAGAKPAPIDRPQPAYPSLAENAGVEGKVRLRFDVRDDGSVGNVRVVESIPPLLFDSVALYAVSAWTYELGKPAESQQITLRFDLTDEQIAAAAAAAGEDAR